ncbi:MAG: type II toxin-antitoxin system prevent-host-death family antitoxin [Alteromonadaceae bacterium]|nr:MAG: type II toxin-antitoxin system prevent-host-death family antitoxin [Alteromonadaceae bacterium]
MKVVSATEVKSRFGEYLDQALEQPIFVEKHAKPKVVIIGYKRYLSLIAMEERLAAEAENFERELN